MRFPLRSLVMLPLYDRRHVVGEPMRNQLFPGRRGPALDEIHHLGPGDDFWRFRRGRFGLYHRHRPQKLWIERTSIATLFDANQKGEHLWDGIAPLWWDKPLPKPRAPIGAKPSDSFQEKAEPYVPWASSEYIVMNGSENLRVEPLTLNAPFPCTRSGFYKVTYLVKAVDGADFAQFYTHWLNTHVPNVRSTMEEVGGFRYVVSHSIDPKAEPYAGLAELYFHDETGWARYRQAIKPDGMEKWVDREGTLALGGRTEMIGLP